LPATTPVNTTHLLWQHRPLRQQAGSHRFAQLSVLWKAACWRRRHSGRQICYGFTGLVASKLPPTDSRCSTKRRSGLVRDNATRRYTGCGCSGLFASKLARTDWRNRGRLWEAACWRWRRSGWQIYCGFTGLVASKLPPTDSRCSTKRRSGLVRDNATRRYTGCGCSGPFASKLARTDWRNRGRLWEAACWRWRRSGWQICCGFTGLVASKLPPTGGRRIVHAKSSQTSGPPAGPLSQVLLHAR
jgi:hypothetical protein